MTKRPNRLEVPCKPPNPNDLDREITRKLFAAVLVQTACHVKSTDAEVRMDAADFLFSAGGGLAAWVRRADLPLAVLGRLRELGPDGFIKALKAAGLSRV